MEYEAIALRTWYHMLMISFHGAKLFRVLPTVHHLSPPRPSASVIPRTSPSPSLMEGSKKSDPTSTNFETPLPPETCSWNLRSNRQCKFRVQPPSTSQKPLEKSQLAVCFPHYPPPWSWIWR